ncbi:WGxxGxxG family protein [Roseomonas chloroacetimidivorans]|uniref:WGxxGxxG family protein n=1 Tax=Roseomonas chloroacetimidivorans TaxID=1766656 RepID=UPI003C7713E7
MAAVPTSIIGGAAAARTNAPGITASPGPARTEECGFDWGWLGLLGLVGLAGLSGRRRTHTTHTAGTSSINRP